MDLQLANKSVLVSGSTAGIGFAIAALFAEEGATVILNGRTQGRVKEEIAAMVVYISSPRASGTNGAALRVEGGVVWSI